jgi:hypothetical protein
VPQIVHIAETPRKRSCRTGLFSAICASDLVRTSSSPSRDRAALERWRRQDFGRIEAHAATKLPARHAPLASLSQPPGRWHAGATLELVGVDEQRIVSRSGIVSRLAHEMLLEEITRQIEHAERAERDDDAVSHARPIF